MNSFTGIFLGSKDNIQDPKFSRFYLLTKIYKQPNTVPGRPVISDCAYYSKNLSAFVDFFL